MLLLDDFTIFVYGLELNAFIRAFIVKTNSVYDSVLCLDSLP